MGEVVGSFARRVASPVGSKSLRRDGLELTLERTCFRHGDQEVEARIAVNLREEFRREVFAVGHNQGTAVQGLQDVRGQVE